MTPVALMTLGGRAGAGAARRTSTRERAGTLAISDELPRSGGLGDRRRGDRFRRNGRRRRRLAELDPDRRQPAPEVAVDRRGTERHRLVELPLRRMEDEGLRLEATETAVRADELLEGRDLAHLRVVLAQEQQVRRVGHRVLALEAHDRVRAEDHRRVLALDAVLVEVS